MKGIDWIYKTHFDVVSIPNRKSLRNMKVNGWNLISMTILGYVVLS